MSFLSQRARPAMSLELPVPPRYQPAWDDDLRQAVVAVSFARWASLGPMRVRSNSLNPDSQTPLPFVTFSSHFDPSTSNRAEFQPSGVAFALLEMELVTIGWHAVP
jgi:hypothetical protein